jgi:hypothetical protein
MGKRERPEEGWEWPTFASSLEQVGAGGGSDGGPEAD